LSNAEAIDEMGASIKEQRMDGEKETVDGRTQIQGPTPSSSPLSSQQERSSTVATKEEVVMSQPTVSIVLPVYNSSKDLIPTLAELERQTYPNKEIIVVDDGSTDETWTVAQSAERAGHQVRVIRTEHGGASHARNTGTNASKGGIVFFAESDCVYEPQYLERAMSEMSAHPSAGAVCLTGAPLMVKSTLATECIDIENKVQHKLLSEGKIKPFYAWVYRRDVLLELGGFDERLFQAEDKDLFKRLKAAGFEVLWVPGIHWRHKRDQTLFQLTRKWFERGRSRLLYSLKHRMLAELAKNMVPVACVAAAIAVFATDSPLAGSLLLVGIVCVFVVFSLRTVSITWSVVSRKRFFIGYPIFILARNLSTGLGYWGGLFSMVVRKIQGREINWSTV
jgi:glycosyltransferase involved in cell wall biosynthesis